MFGPGIYDPQCTRAREDAQTVGALLIILGGKHGNGFACQAPRQVMSDLPALLRGIAARIEADMTTPGGTA